MHKKKDPEVTRWLHAVKHNAMAAHSIPEASQVHIMRAERNASSAAMMCTLCDSSYHCVSTVYRVKGRHIPMFLYPTVRTQQPLEVRQFLRNSCNPLLHPVRQLSLTTILQRHAHALACNNNERITPAPVLHAGRGAACDYGITKSQLENNSFSIAAGY